MKKNKNYVGGIHSVKPTKVFSSPLFKDIKEIYPTIWIESIDFEHLKPIEQPNELEETLSNHFNKLFDEMFPCNNVNSQKDLYNIINHNSTTSHLTQNAHYLNKLPINILEITCNFWNIELIINNGLITGYVEVKDER